MDHHGDAQINHDTTQPDAKIIGWWVGSLTTVIAITVWLAFYFYEGLLTNKFNQLIKAPDSKQIVYTRELLNTPEMIDPKSGKVRLALPSAMERVLKDYQR
jgi:hypothetical protein